MLGKKKSSHCFAIEYKVTQQDPQLPWSLIS